MLRVVVEEQSITLRYNRRQEDNETRFFRSVLERLEKEGSDERELKVVEGLYLAWHTLRSGAAERGRAGANEDGSRRQSQEDLRELHDGFFIYFESVAARSGIGAAARRELQRQIMEARESLFSGQ